MKGNTTEAGDRPAGHPKKSIKHCLSAREEEEGDSWKEHRQVQGGKRIFLYPWLVAEIDSGEIRNKRTEYWGERSIYANADYR